MGRESGVLAREDRSWLSLDGEKRGERRKKREERREKRGERRDGARNEEWGGRRLKKASERFFFLPWLVGFFPLLSKNRRFLSLSLSLSLFS